jgi:hypothetical protein
MKKFILQIIAICKLLKIISGAVGKNPYKTGGEEGKPDKEILWPDYAGRQLQAREFRRCLASKIVEMRNDSTTTPMDWVNFLPLCCYSDQLYEETHPEQKGFRRKETVVIELIDFKLRKS